MILDLPMVFSQSPEYDDVARAAREWGVSWGDVVESANQAK